MSSAFRLALLLNAMAVETLTLFTLSSQTSSQTPSGESVSSLLLLGLLKSSTRYCAGLRPMKLAELAAPSARYKEFTDKI